MNIVLKIFSLIIIAGVIYLAYLNNGNSINILQFSINVMLYTFAILFAGILASAIWFSQSYLSQKDKTKTYKRELEKSSVSNNDNSAKVEVLQAKITTLEKALEDALNK